MLTRELLMIIACMCVLTMQSYISSSSISTCITYESDTSKKWCRYSTSTTSGYACSSTETSSVCGGSSYYRCSSDSSSYLPQNSKKLLCPTDSSNCNTQTYSLSSSSSKALYSGYFDTNTFCWYKFTPYSSYTDKMTIKINSLTNANAEVYYESSTNDYTYKGSLSSGGSMDVSVSYNNPVWVLVIPSSSSAFVNVTATTNYSYSSYSSYSTDSSYLVAIIVPTVVGGTILIVCVILIIVCSVIRRQRMLQYQNNMAAAVAYPANPAPQIYYPPQQNYNVGYTNQGAVVMGTQYSTYPSPQTPRQNAYIIEPTPRTSEPIAYGPAAPVPENSIYVAQGVPVNL